MGVGSSVDELTKLARLLQERSIHEGDDLYWDKLCSVPPSAEDVWSVFTLEGLRKVKKEAPYNFATFIRKLVAKLAQTVFEDKSRRNFKVTLNAVRLLTRAVSVVAEEPQNKLWAEDFMWKNVFPQFPGVDAVIAPQPESSSSSAPSVAPSTLSSPAPSAVTTTVSQPAPGSAPDTPQPALPEPPASFSLSTHLGANPASASASASSSSSSSSTASSAPAPVPIVPLAVHGQSWQPSAAALDFMQQPIAQQIVKLLTELLFMPDLTIVAEVTEQVEHGVYLGKLWTAAPSPKGALDSNRTEILRCLLACFSEGVYIPPEQFRHGDNRWLAVMVAREHKLAPTLFYSLLNTICSYEPVGLLPYSHQFFTDYREPLVDLSLQLLLVLLDCRDLSSLYSGPDVLDPTKEEKKDPTAQLNIVSRESRELKEEFVPPAPEKLPNVFRDCFLSISREEDLKVVYDGLTALLNNAHEALNTYLINSIKLVQCQQEVFILIWKLLDENQYFFRYVMEQADVLKLLVPLIYSMWDAKGDRSKIGLMYSSVFILLRLSGERDFCVALNKPFNVKLPLSDFPRFTGGTFADILIIVTHKVIVSSPDHLDALLHILLTVLSNVSPYVTRMELLSSMKLVNLFELFSSPRFLYANESNNQYIFLLLDVFNNVIQHQYQGNARLVYAILRRAKLFYKLGRVPGSNASSLPVVDGSQSTGQSISPSASSDLNLPVFPPSAHDDMKEEAAFEQRGRASGFVPTPEWALEWKKRLPLEPIFRLLEFFLPKVEALVRSAPQVDDTKFLEMIKNGTLVGVLPLPRAIAVRRYIPNVFTNLWFSSYLWGVIYVRNQSFPVMDASNIKMFVITIVEDAADLKTGGKPKSPPAAAAATTEQKANH